jgi:hypothetical protein
MRYGEGRRKTRVPSNVSEEQMIQLLVSGFNANVRKQWRVKTRNLVRRVMEEYKLHTEWSYELVPREEAAPPPRPRMVQARTRYQGLNWDIELDASWSRLKVWEAVTGVWKEEMAKKGSPSTEIEVRDEQNRRRDFMVHEGWTYVLQEVDWSGPEWTSRKEYKQTQKKRNPDESVLIGMQLEDGMRIERNVQAGTEETRLKNIMQKELDPPDGDYFLHIRNARNEEVETYAIGRQWTYTLRKRPRRQTAKRKTGTETGFANVRLRTSWNLTERHVTANRDWDEERSTIEFKKLAGVQQSLPCKLRVENQAGEKVRFEINTTFSYTLVIAR